MPDTPPPRQILHVQSTNYAGSHFLGLQLASHSACVSTGELHHIKRARAKRRQVCSFCPSDDQCPVLAGTGDLPIPQVYPQIFRNLTANFPGVSVAVDISKKHDWADQFLDLPGVEQKYVHLIRDPRALIRRWQNNYDSPDEKRKVRRLMARRCWPHALDVLSGTEANVYVWKWLYQNKLLTDFYRRRRLDHRVVSYHDIVVAPEAVLRDLMGWLGLHYEPDQLHYWTHTHHGSFKPQYMQPPPAGANFLDQRWRDDLDLDAIELPLGRKDVLDYLASLDLVLDDHRGLVGPYARRAGIA